MKIVIGNDHTGVALKLEIVQMLEEEGYKVINCGVDTTDSVDYPDIAEQVTREVLNQDILGVLICGTGIGISIAANKIAGIRAALCQNIYTAQMAREHNNANIVALGARVTGAALAVEIVRSFVKSDFQAGRHLKRVEKIIEIEKKRGDRR